MLALVIKGLSNVQIARQLDISLSTARFHVSTILSKLGAANRAEAVALVLAACGPGTDSGDKTWEQKTEALQNAEYQTEWTLESTVRLENGEYQAPAAPGSASEIVIALTEHVAVGELDGQPATAVILYSSGGGSGTFYELHVMVERHGQPQDVAWTQLGDQVQINSLSIHSAGIGFFNDA